MVTRPAPPRGFVAIVRPPRADESGSLDKPAYPRDSRNRPLYRAASGMALILGPRDSARGLFRRAAHRDTLLLAIRRPKTGRTLPCVFASNRCSTFPSK